MTTAVTCMTWNCVRLLSLRLGWSISPCIWRVMMTLGERRGMSSHQMPQFLHINKCFLGWCPVLCRNRVLWRWNFLISLSWDRWQATSVCVTSSLSEYLHPVASLSNITCCIYLMNDIEGLQGGSVKEPAKLLALSLWCSQYIKEPEIWQRKTSFFFWDCIYFYIPCIEIVCS